LEGLEATAAPALPGARGAGPPLHIVDVLIEERARELRRNAVAWCLIRTFLYPVLKYRQAIEMADRIASLSGRETFEYVTELLAMHLEVQGLEHVPRTGPCVLVSNHPTGIADGLALYQALKGVRSDLRYFANRDAIRVSPGLADMLVPVEWVLEKRSLAKTREMWREAKEAFRKGQMIVMFPSGRVAQLRSGHLVDRPWHDTTIAIARRNEAPIVPLHMSAWNSWIYYFFARVREELRDMTLFNELFNKRGKTFKFTFGPVIPYQDLSGDPAVEILRLRKYIEEDLPAGRSWKSAV
jgi:putative hemolysin